MADRLTKRYSGRRGVDDLSFAVRPGQICAPLGPNGAIQAATVALALAIAWIVFTYRDPAA